LVGSHRSPADGTTVSESGRSDRHLTAVRPRSARDQVRVGSGDTRTIS
jgi:hypothetical protein